MHSSHLLWGSGLLVGIAAQEVHTIYFNNQFVLLSTFKIQPTLIKGNSVLSTGGNFTINGPLGSAIAYLQSSNGEGCTLLETSLVNPTPGDPGSGSSSDISLIPPYVCPWLPFSDSITLLCRYFNGCDGQGAEYDCPMAFHSPNETWVQVSCQDQDANLEVGLLLC
ncbi:glycopeptide [Mycena olivaceomarginata]|nr:glycopeptide [Mycena olivaceomarginata]